MDSVTWNRGAAGCKGQMNSSKNLKFDLKAKLSFLKGSLLGFFSILQHALVLLNKGIVLEAGFCKRSFLALRFCKYDVLRSSQFW